MASHKSNWLALTCHDSWAFFCLHNRTPDARHAPYVTYSKVEKTSDTKAFRALLAMMLTAHGAFEVESKADIDDNNLSPLEEAQEETEDDPKSQSPNFGAVSTYEPFEDHDSSPTKLPRKHQNDVNTMVDVKVSELPRPPSALSH